MDAPNFEMRAELEASSGGPNFDRRRWFWEDRELVQVNEKTYAFSNQWGGENWHRAMNLLKEKYPLSKIEFVPSS